MCVCVCVCVCARARDHKTRLSRKSVECVCVSVCVCVCVCARAHDHTRSHGPRILQARILEWVAVSFSRGSSWPRDPQTLFIIPISLPTDLSVIWDSLSERASARITSTSASFSRGFLGPRSTANQSCGVSHVTLLKVLTNFFSVPPLFCLLEATSGHLWFGRKSS